MRLAKFSDALEEAVREAHTEREALEALAAFTGSYFLCDRVVLSFNGLHGLMTATWGGMQPVESGAASPVTLQGGTLGFQGKRVPIPLYISDLARFSPPSPVSDYMKEKGVRSYVLIPVAYNSENVGWLECYHSREFHLWRREEQTVLNILAARIPLILRTRLPSGPLELQGRSEEERASSSAPSPGQVYYERLSEVQREYRRLLDYGNFVLFKTNPEFTLIDVRGDTERMLGVRPAEVLEDPDIWARILPTKARLMFIQKIRRARKRREELYDELKIVHIKTGEERWILFRGVPLFSESNQLLGWEAIGLDITDKKTAEEALLHEKRRLQALYDVSHASQFSAEPEIIALKSLRALKNATRSGAAFIALYNSRLDALELVAADGLREEEASAVSDMVKGSEVFRTVLEAKAGTIVRDLQKMAGRKGRRGKVRPSVLRSAIIMPLMADDDVQGICCLARKSTRAYYHEDYSLVQLACSEIGRRIKQAQFHIDEKKAADSVGVLYRLSHELSKYLTVREVAEHAVAIISEELPCKRLWLGIINEQRTHVAGQAGYGAGIRRSVIQLQLELDLPHESFDEAIQSKKPVIVQPGQKMDCSGLEKLISKISPQSFVIVPMVSLGQVLGVLIFEPTNPSLFFAEGTLALLINIASEIATVLLARRFEAKVADTEKMKMAGLLASGVSHNFNNLLQAVMGHASLIQMQSSPGSRVEDSAKRIVEAAGKGASLVNQLMTVSSMNNFSRRSLSVNKMFQESRDFYKSILGPEISLEMDLDEDVPNVLADYSQLQQIMSNLLLNSKEAIEGRHDGFVKIQSRGVRLKSGEVSGDLSPGPYLRIDVQDNGKGMSDEVQARCFEPFYTTKSRDPGTGVGVGASGLGLSSVHSILRQHAGAVTARSREGAGCVFTVFLPVLQKVDQAAPKGRIEVLHQKQPNVLVFSNDDVVNSAVRLSIEAFGLLSDVSKDPDALRDIFSKKGRKFRGIVVVDLDDIDLQANRLETVLPAEVKDVPCILLGNDPERWQALVKRFQYGEFVKKPLGAWKMHAAISKLLSYGTPGRERLAEGIELQVGHNRQKRRKSRRSSDMSNGKREGKAV